MSDRTESEQELAAEFARKCREASTDILGTLSRYPNSVSLCVLVFGLASAAQTFGVRRDAIVAMIDDAIQQIADIDAAKRRAP